MAARRRTGRRGGRAGLHRLLSEHGEALEADLHRYYQLDLLDLFRGRLTWRKLGVLVRHLPLDSATVQAQLGYEPASRVEHLLYGLFDATQFANWQRVAMQTKKSKRSPAPKRLPRPGERAASPTGLPVTDLRDFQQRHQQRRQEVERAV